MHEAQTGALLTAVLLVPALLAPALPAPAPAGAKPLPTTRAGRPGATFDHGYTAYGAILREHVIGDRIDYASLRRNRAALDSVVSDFEETPAAGLANWTDRERMAYWINAYNAFTLQAVTDHYPITRNLLSPAGWLAPADSIRQIAGFRTRQRWQPGGRPRSLDDILHEELRTGFDEPRIHFALYCAAAGCPPLRREPYTPVRLERQLILAARDHLASASTRMGRPCTCPASCAAMEPTSSTATDAWSMQAAPRRSVPCGGSSPCTDRPTPCAWPAAPAPAFATSTSTGP